MSRETSNCLRDWAPRVCQQRDWRILLWGAWPAHWERLKILPSGLPQRNRTLAHPQASRAQVSSLLLTAPPLTYDAHTEEPESEESTQCKRVEGTTSKRNKAVQKQKL